MKLTIRNKMIGIGCMALLGLLVMFSVNYWAGGTVATSQAMSQLRNDQLQIVNEMNVAKYELLLSAMDSIVDRDAGMILPERMDVINEAAKFLSENVTALKELADTATEQAAARTFEEQSGRLVKGVKQDLAALLADYGANYARIEAEFAQIDDLIDEHGEQSDQGLATLEKAVMQRVEQSSFQERAEQDELVMGAQLDQKSVV